MFRNENVTTNLENLEFANYMAQFTNYTPPPTDFGNCLVWKMDLSNLVRKSDCLKCLVMQRITHTQITLFVVEATTTTTNSTVIDPNPDYILD